MCDSIVIQKQPPEKYVGVAADELYDLTSEMAPLDVYDWSDDQITRAVSRMREVSCFFMRGEPKAKMALAQFHEKWCDFVCSRPDIKQLLDPEVSREKKKS